MIRRLIEKIRRRYRKIYEDEDIYVIEYREKNKDPHYIIMLKKPLIIRLDIEKDLKEER
jgi:hypothetical protein